VIGVRAKARVAGLAYLIIMIAAPFAELLVRSGAIVRGDAAATAANILASEGLWRLAFVSDLLVVVCDVTVAALLYDILKPVGRAVSLTAAFFRLALVAVSAVKALAHLAALLILDGGEALAAFTPAQLEALSFLSVRLHGQGYSIALFFFGFHCLLVGWLIARATFLPRIIGWLMMLAGVCYVFNSAAGFIDPEFSRVLFPYILLPALPAEGGLTLWLLLVGVNEAKWRTQAGVA
jgi:hypothetical protein